MDSGPLNDITVIDFSHARAGPWCTELLGELGAKIIKIERPGGDSNRHSYPQQGGMGIAFISKYRNKKSVVIDLKTEDGRELAENLIRQADVLVENFSPGVMDRLGLGHEYLLAEVNPQLVYASIKGYGETGPFKDKKGVDLVMQAEGGIMSVTGPVGGPPVKVGQAIGDIGAGLYSIIGILTALRRVEHGGSGQKIEVDLFGTIVSFMEDYLTMYGMTGEDPAPNGTRHQTHVPYEMFETKDGKLVLYVPDARWELFATEAMNDESLLEFDSLEERQERYDELMAIMRPIIREKSTEEWIERFDELGLPCGQLNSVSDLIDHPQTTARNDVIRYDDPHLGEIILHGYPIHFSEDELEFQNGPPQLGEHTELILTEELGLGTDEIATLRDNDVIG